MKFAFCQLTFPSKFKDNLKQIVIVIAIEDQFCEYI